MIHPEYIGQEVFYVNPFIFTIEKVVIADAVPAYFVEGHPESFYEWYIEAQSEAPLSVDDVFITLEEAKKKAIEGLENFYNKKRQEIIDVDSKFKT